uniref:MATH domain-containing protein n=2 Tax=Brassica TaxID=3705 RepID=A0A0D3APD7_BRAOL
MGSVSAEISTTAKKWRDHPPSSYSLKVDNFKQLEKLARHLSRMGSVSAEISTTAKKWRDHPPSSYSLKVDNFKQLEKFASSSDDKYQSRLFSSGGYNWKLIVYPKGNKTDNGKGFISMYVEIDSKSLISAPQREVFAELIFFVYNKKENKYFTVQDVEALQENSDLLREKIVGMSSE